MKAQVVFAEGEVVGLRGPQGGRYYLREIAGPPTPEAEVPGAYVEYYRVSGKPWILAYEERWNPRRKRVEARAFFATDPAPQWVLCY